MSYTKRDPGALRPGMALFTLFLAATACLSEKMEPSSVTLSDEKIEAKTGKRTKVTVLSDGVLVQTGDTKYRVTAGARQKSDIFPKAPYPQNATVLSDIEGVFGRTVNLAVTGSVTTVIEKYRSLLKEAGYIEKSAILGGGMFSGFYDDKGKSSSLSVYAFQKNSLTTRLTLVTGNSGS